MTAVMDNKFQTLTRGEEEVMQLLWRIGEATVAQIIEQMAEPKPKYTTVATFIKILENCFLPILVCPAPQPCLPVPI